MTIPSEVISFDASQCPTMAAPCMHAACSAETPGSFTNPFFPPEVLIYYARQHPQLRTVAMIRPCSWKSVTTDQAKLLPSWSFPDRLQRGAREMTTSSIEREREREQTCPRRRQGHAVARQIWQGYLVSEAVVNIGGRRPDIRK